MSPALLTTEILDLFNRIPREGTALLQVGCLRRPIGARELAERMGIDEHTAAKYLLTLSEQSLVARTGYKQGYVLAERGRLFLVMLGQFLSTSQFEANGGIQGDPDWTVEVMPAGISQNPPHPEGISQYPAGAIAHTGQKSPNSPHAAVAGISQYPEYTGDHTGKNSQHPPHADAHNGKNSQHPPHADAHNGKNSQQPVNITTTTTDINLINDLRDSVVVVDQISKNSQKDAPALQSEVWQELIAAGIGVNQRTRELVRQPHVTPEYVKAHRLKLVASGKSGPKWAGLLVMILESGEPAPELNPNGHLAACDCLDCHAYRLARSWAED